MPTTESSPPSEVVAGGVDGPPAVEDLVDERGTRGRRRRARPPPHDRPLAGAAAAQSAHATTSASAATTGAYFTPSHGSATTAAQQGPRGPGARRPGDQRRWPTVTASAAGSSGYTWVP